MSELPRIAPVEERRRIIQSIAADESNPRYVREYGERILAKMDGRPVPKIVPYLLTKEQRAALEEQQGGRCAICGRQARKLVVDHDHETGVVRGLLCHGCNTSMGVLGDSVEGLERAIAYLKRVQDA